MRPIDADSLMKDIQGWLKPDNENEDILIRVSDIAISVLMEIEEQPTLSEWINVNEGLPSNVMGVLAYHYKEKRCIPAFYGDGEWYDCIFDCIVHGITHWMYLPDPPRDRQLDAEDARKKCNWKKEGKHDEQRHHSDLGGNHREG